jgi:hypothetical protein
MASGGHGPATGGAAPAQTVSGEHPPGPGAGGRTFAAAAVRAEAGALRRRGGAGHRGRRHAVRETAGVRAAVIAP